ncbi:MAG: autotransporter-associated beta strand repeat-containing protein [Planctomycetaceae bacterium]|nr:autotransporter-associated beta strand repeat-containing protein [Planctomycetaceae bacterium]
MRQGATLNITGGGLSGGSVTGGNGGSGGNTITPAAGSAIGSAIFLAGSASYTVSSGTVTIADTIGGGVDTQITGGFAKKGAGILELTAANTYVGGTSIDAGLLLANNSTGSATGNGIVTVKNTGTLGGSGFITGAVTVKSGGSIAPGNSPGILTVTGNTVFESGGIFNVQLDGATAGTEYDRLNVVGLVTVTDAILTGTVGYAASAADKLFILTNDGSDGITGTFAGLAEGGTVNLGTYTALITYQGNSATGDLTGGNDIALYSFAVIPEPATMALLAMGGVALMIRRRRRA